MARRYPLEPLVGIRREKTEQRALELGRTTEASARAARQAEAAKERRTRVRAGVLEEKQREQARLERGEQCARDLQQGERFRAGADARLAELAAFEREAERRSQEASLAEGRARQALGAARAEERAVERHRESFRAENARAHEEAEQQAAEERWASAKHGARRD